MPKTWPHPSTDMTPTERLVLLANGEDPKMIARMRSRFCGHG